MTDLRFPIGEFVSGPPASPEERAARIDTIERTPAQLRAAVDGLTDPRLDTSYRPGGWTVRQVVHHLPDSHCNSFMRLKLALVEDVPTVGVYDEAAWAELPDARAPVEMSLALLERLHERWVYLWRALCEDDWQRRFRHPELGNMDIDGLLALYAWHGPHHVAHITSLRAREGW